MVAYPADSLCEVINNENRYTPVINNIIDSKATVNSPNFKPPTKDSKAIL